MDADRLGSPPGEGLTVPILAHHGVTPTVHPTAYIAGGAWLIGDVGVGKESSVWFNAVLRGDINAIRLGERTNIQDAAVLHVTHELMVWIGDDVTVGHNAIVHGCRIERGALIGMGAVVLDNAKIGEGALVAAGSVVKEGFVVPDGMLAAGVPARIVRPLSDPERKALLDSAGRYVTYAGTYKQ